MSVYNNNFSDDRDLVEFEGWLQNELKRQETQDDRFTKSVMSKISEIETGFNDFESLCTMFSMGLGVLSISVLLINNLLTANDLLTVVAFTKDITFTCLLLISCWAFQNFLDAP